MDIKDDSASIKYTLLLDLTGEDKYDAVIVDLRNYFISRFKKINFSVY